MHMYEKKIVNMEDLLISGTVTPPTNSLKEINQFVNPF